MVGNGGYVDITDHDPPVSKRPRWRRWESADRRTPKVCYRRNLSFGTVFTNDGFVPESAFRTCAKTEQGTTASEQSSGFRNRRISGREAATPDDRLVGLSMLALKLGIGAW